MIDQAKITARHITLGTIATMVTILGSIGGGLMTLKKYADDREQANIRQVLEHERHDVELDRRLDRIELAVKLAVSNDSKKQQDLIDKVLTVQNQLQAVKQTQKSLKEAIGQDDVDDQSYPADAPAVKPPQ